MEQIKIIWLDLIDKITINPHGRHISSPVKTVQQYVYVSTKKER